MTNLETQTRTIVNWAHVMNVEISQTHYGCKHVEGDADKWSVMAYPAFPIEYPGVILYTSTEQSHCEAYMEWLKAQLDVQQSTGKSVIRHSYEPSDNGQPADKTWRYMEPGTRVTWTDDNDKTHIGTLVGPAKYDGYYEVQGDDHSFPRTVASSRVEFYDD